MRQNTWWSKVIPACVRIESTMATDSTMATAPTSNAIPKWEYEDDYNHWAALHETTSQILEEYFLAGRSEIWVVNTDSSAYVYNLVTMTQTRVWGGSWCGRARRIRRIEVLAGDDTPGMGADWAAMAARVQAAVVESDANAAG